MIRMRDLFDGLGQRGAHTDHRVRDSVRRRGRAGTGALLASALAATLALGGCKDVEPAPEDLDGLFHYFWSQHVDGADEELAAALVNFNALVEADYDLSVEDTYDGQLSDISQGEIDLVEMRDDANPDETTGLFLINSFQCTVGQYEQIAYALNQGALYDDAYDHYEREYTSDLDAYTGRETSHLTWISYIDATLVGASYHEDVHGDLRYIPDLGDGDTPWGHFVVARYHMPEEAEFGNPDFFFTQDYQIEIFYEAVPGEVIHLYGLWRNMGFGEASTNDESIQRLILNGLSDWDDRTEEICNSGQF